MIVVLSISSAAIIVKLLMIKQTRKNLNKKMPQNRNFFSAIFTKGSSSKATGNEGLFKDQQFFVSLPLFFNDIITKDDNGTSVNLVSDTKSSGDSKAVASKALKTAKAAARSKNNAINGMIVSLALATLASNISYIVLYYNNNEDQVNQLLAQNNFTRIVVNREVDILLILVKFSVTGLLFFVSGEIFRTNLYAFSKKCWRLIKCC
jgi:hypothetical protein